MSQTARIRRGAAAPRPGRAVAARPKAAARKVGAKADTLFGRLPISPALRRRIARWLTIGAGALAIVALLLAFRVPALLAQGLGTAAGAAGLQVRHIEVKGLDKMEQLQVNAIVLGGETDAMPLVDLSDIRDRLLALGWVKEARVSRRLPDTLVIDIVERTPAAIWQNRQQLQLIDADGVVLGPVHLAQMPDLPLVIGPAANRQAVALNRLLAGAPQLKPMFAGATWVGERRWDLRFHSGETLSLPEGEIAATKALVHFARLDAAHGMLGQNFVRFDMRVPSKLTIRMSREPGKRVDLDAKAG